MLALALFFSIGHDLPDQNEDKNQRKAIAHQGAVINTRRQGPIGLGPDRYQQKGRNKQEAPQESAERAVVRVTSKTIGHGQRLL